MRHAATLLCSVVLMFGAEVCRAQGYINPDLGALVLFPDRDFVTIEGFETLADTSFKTEVLRNGEVVGAAWSKGSGGDVAAEVNHPGGECWGDNDNSPHAPSGAGADIPDSLQVTPNIRGGDVVRIVSETGAVLGSQAVQDAVVDKTSKVGTNIFVIEGTIGGVNPAFLECRIIQPEWVPTFGRRDARAIPGGLTPSDKGGYSSGMSVSNGRFVCTFQFLAASDRDLAPGGTSRIMSWIAEDGINRLGLTIAEFGEVGGPGMGGCPNGPGSVGAPQGSFAAIRSGNSVQFDWTKPQSVPDAAPIVGYYLTAIEMLATADQRVERGMRISNPGTAKATLTVETGKEYEYEMRSITDGGAFSKAFSKLPTGSSNATGGTPPPPLKTKLDGNVVTFERIDNQTVTFNAAGGLELWFTVSETADVTPVTLGADTVSPNALMYKEPITLPATGTRYIDWIAFNDAGLYTRDSATLTVAAAVLIRDPPTLKSAIAGKQALTLGWTAADPNINTFDVQLFDAAAAGTLVESKSVPKTVRELPVSGLSETKEYWFTVRGVNVGGVPGPWAARAGGFKPNPITDDLTFGAVRYRANKEFKADGTASNSTALLHLCRGTIPPSSTCTRLTTDFQAVPPAAGVAGPPTWSIKLTNAAANIPGGVTPLYIKSSMGGIKGPATVGNRRLRRAAL